MAEKKPPPRAEAGPPPETAAALDEWADKIASLEPDVARGINKMACRLANDPRLSEADRQFAEAQVEAICRAIRRAKARLSTGEKS